MMDKKTMILTSVVMAVTSIAQIVLAVVFYNHLDNSLLCNIGWVIIWISAIFGWLPIYTFRKHGGVSKGKSYMHTEKFVDKGVYGIVRHPQYLAGILISIGLYLITQHWASLVLGLVDILQYYLSATGEEKNLLKKFGDVYHDYMQRVPRFNFLLGIPRRIFSDKK